MKKDRQKIKHIHEMKKLEKEILKSHGYRKNDLIRKWQRMNKDLIEYNCWRNGNEDRI